MKHNFLKIINYLDLNCHLYKKERIIYQNIIKVI
jgi:hypothetical protein